MKQRNSIKKELPKEKHIIINEWFVCDRCGKERDQGEIRGCGRRMIKLCSGCIKEIEEDGVE